MNNWVSIARYIPYKEGLILSCKCNKFISYLMVLGTTAVAYCEVDFRTWPRALGPFEVQLSVKTTHVA